MLKQAITNRASVQQARDHAPDRVDNYRPTEDPDAALVDALRARDAKAFDDLVKRHQRRLLNVALRITRNREDAEDVVQDSFLNVFKHLNSFRGDSQFASWLTRVTINQALMKIRGNTQKFVPLDEGAESEDRLAIREIQDYGYTPEQLYAQREFEDAVLNLAANVRKSSRRIIELQIEEDLSDVEVAQLLRLTLSAVKARLYRGRQDLREAMGRLFPSGSLSRLCRIAPAARGRAKNYEETQSPEYVLASGAGSVESSGIHASV